MPKPKPRNVPAIIPDKDYEQRVKAARLAMFNQWLVEAADG